MLLPLHSPRRRRRRRRFAGAERGSRSLQFALNPPIARERALRNPGLFSADGLFAPTEEPDDFEFDGDGELDELTSADFGEDPYLHVDT